MARLTPNWGWFGSSFGGWSGNRLEQVQHYKGWPYIAIKAICEEIAGMHPTVARVLQPDQAAQSKSLLPRRYRMKALAALQEYEELEPVKHNHPLARLLRNPNPPDTAYTFFYKLFLYLELTGISYVWKVRNGIGLPCELWVIPAQWVRPMPDPDKQKLIHHYEIRPFGIGASACKFDVPVDDMIAIAYPNPLAPYTDGYSPFNAVAQWQDTAEAVDLSRFYQFRNGPHSTLVAKLDKEMHDPTQDQMDKFRQQVAQEYAGVRNTGKVLIPAPGVELSSLSNTPEEMAYVPGADQLRTWLLATYRTGSSIVGLAEQASFASMIAERANFSLSTIRPKLVMTGQALTEHLAHDFDKDLVTYWPDNSPNDPAQKLAENQAYIDRGVLSVNEVRSELGHEPYPHGGDNPMLPMGLSEVPWAKAMPMEAGWELPPGPGMAGVNGDVTDGEQNGQANGDGHLSTESNGSVGPRLSTEAPGLNRRGALGELSKNGKT